jgi:hypothetical protein
MEKVELSQVSAPMGGTDLFQLKAKVSCESFSFEEMRKKLEKFDDPLLISLELKSGN